MKIKYELEKIRAGLKLDKPFSAVVPAKPDQPVQIWLAIGALETDPEFKARTLLLEADAHTLDLAGWDMPFWCQEKKLPWIIVRHGLQEGTVKVSSYSSEYVIEKLPILTTEEFIIQYDDYLTGVIKKLESELSRIKTLRFNFYTIL